MSRTTLFLAFIVSAIFCTASALYSADSPVVQLTDSDFKSKVQGSGVWLVEFYAPWCGHCKALAPDWEKVAVALKGVVNVASVDVTKEESLGSEYEIRWLPTIKLFYTDSSGNLKATDRYEGERTVKDLISFALDKARNLAFENIGDTDFADAASDSAPVKEKEAAPKEVSEDFYIDTSVTVLTAENFDEKVTQSNEPWLIEFYAPWCGHCKKLKPTWIELATELNGKVNVGAINCEAHESVCSKNEITGYPTIMFFGTDKKWYKYQGPRDTSSLATYALSENKPNAKTAGGSSGSFYDGTNVTVLTADNFKALVTESKDPWMVEFFSPQCGPCINMKPVYIEVANDLVGKVKVGAVDCKAHKLSLCKEYDISKYPTFMYFGNDKASPVEYERGHHAQTMVNYALRQIGELKDGGSGAETTGPFYTGTNVVVLTADDFDTKVTESSEPWLVEFYAPWCGHCKKLKPTWIELATELKGKVNVGAVDCTEQESVCDKIGVSGYPTVMFFGPDKTAPLEYSGARDTSSLVAFATSDKRAAASKPSGGSAGSFYEGTNVTILNLANFKDLVVNTEDSWMVKFYSPGCGPCINMKPVFIEVSNELHGKVKVGAVDCKVHKLSLCKEYNIDKFPTFMFFGKDKKSPMEYDWGHQADRMVKYSLKQIGESVEEDYSANANSGPFYTGTDVVVLTDDDFDAKVLKSKKTWFVEFYAPWCGHCKKLKPTWIELATELKGKVNVGAVDCTEQESLCAKVGVDGYPTLMLFGKDKNAPEEYNGFRDTKSLATFATSDANSAKKASKAAEPAPSDDFYAGTDVVTLTESDFSDKVTQSEQLWLVEFYAPWCGHCKKLKPVWIESAKKLKGKVSVGAVDCITQPAVCSDFGVDGYPTVMFFGASKTAPEEYEGKRTVDAIVKFALGKGIFASS